MKGQENDSVTREFESVISRVGGVSAAKVMVDEEGNIAEIHVISDTSRSPKQIVRDIESALIAKYGSQVDHKKISVAQIKGETVKESNGRLHISSVNIKLSGPSAEVEVELIDNEDNVYRGRANGASSSGNRLRLVVKATLEAVKEFVKGAYDFAVEDVSIVSVAKKEAVVTGVIAVSGADEEMLVGSALIKKDATDAAVRAALDALNRRILV